MWRKTGDRRVDVAKIVGFTKYTILVLSRIIHGFS